MTTSERLAGGDQLQETAREQAGGVVSTPVGQQPVAERTLQESLRRLFEGVGAEAVFGNPIERAGATLIPCAEVMMGFGMGGGSGFGPAASATGASTQQTERAPSTRPADGGSGGSGVGGGGGAQGRPVAVVVVSQGEVHVQPVVDVTKLSLAVLTTVGFVGLWMLQAFARTRRLRRRAVSATGFARAMRRARR